MTARSAAAAAGWVGRDAELAALAAAHAQTVAAGGGARCVVVEGAPGVGKTSLARRFLAGVESGRGALATAEAAEAAVDHALADQLLRALGVPRPDVVGQADPPDLATVGLRLLEAIADRAGDGPVTIVVDDAQWADAASLRALLFALRRVAEEAVLAVLVVREGMAERIPSGFLKLGDGERITLAGLSGEEVGALAAAAGRPLSAHGALRLREHTRGNPLYVRALLEQVPASAWEEAERLAPAPELFARHALARLDGAGPEARALVEAAAVLGVRSELRAAAAVAGLGDGGAAGGVRAGGRSDLVASARGGGADPLAALEEAQRLGLLRTDLDAQAIAFDHPLTRAAVYHGMGPACRARLHAAAAEVVAGRGPALRHRAAAATGPDFALAAELEAFANGELLRNAWDSAAESLAAAARLSEGPERERLEIETADALLSGGRPAAARARLGERDETGADARLLSVLAYLALQESRLEDAERLLARAWSSEPLDPQAGQRIAERRAVLAMSRLRPEEALTWARRGAALAPRGGVEELLARWPEALARSACGNHREGRALLDEIIGGIGAAHDDLGLRAMRARMRLLDDDVAGAQEELTAVATAAGRLGSEHMLATVHAWLSKAQLTSGAWDAAALHADRAVSIAAATERPYERSTAHSAAVAVAVARGDLAAAEGHVRVLGEDVTTELSLVTKSAAAALLATARSRPRDVLAAIEPVRAAGLQARAAAQVELRLPVLEADALTRLQRFDEADAVLLPQEAWAREEGRRSLAVALARVRGRLEAARGRDEEAARAFEHALDLAAGLPMPYELALARLARGQFLRRRGQRQRAVALLGQARDCFAELDARPALQQCERELAASGLAPARRTGADRSDLTGRERAVAQLAARGLTNREIAGELMVSVKTIEVHLSRVFAKLDIRSRAEIASRLDPA